GRLPEIVEKLDQRGGTRRESRGIVGGSVDATRSRRENPALTAQGKNQQEPLNALERPRQHCSPPPHAASPGSGPAPPEPSPKVRLPRAIASKIVTRRR